MLQSSALFTVASFPVCQILNGIQKIIVKFIFSLVEFKILFMFTIVSFCKILFNLANYHYLSCVIELHTLHSFNQSLQMASKQNKILKKKLNKTIMVSNFSHLITRNSIQLLEKMTRYKGLSHFKLQNQCKKFVYRLVVPSTLYDHLKNVLFHSNTNMPRHFENGTEITEDQSNCNNPIDHQAHKTMASKSQKKNRCCLIDAAIPNRETPELKILHYQRLGNIKT